MSRLIRAFTRHHSHFTRSMSPGDEFFDVVINGAGLNGIATAISLAKSPAFANRRILMVDKAPETHVAGTPSAPQVATAPKASGDSPQKRGPWNSRVVAVNPSSMQLVHSWGKDTWDRIESNGVGRILQMKLSDASSNAHMSLGDGFETMAWVVETSNMLSVFGELVKEAEASGRLTIRRGTSITDVGSNMSGSLLNLQVDPNPELPLWTKLMLVADGARSSLREQLYFRKLAYDYDQLGIVTTVRLTQPDMETNGTVAYQRFMPTGPIALLPLDNENCSLIWTADKDFAQELMAMSDDEFTDSLNEHLTSDSLVQQPVSDILSQIRSITPRFFNPTAAFNPPTIRKITSKRLTFPLRFMHALPVTQHRVVLLGDAAHTLHPLAGLGLNLGLGDVAELRRVLEEAHESGDDIGTEDQLCKYRCQRNSRSVPLAAATHFIQQIHSTTSAPVVAMRSLGVTALDMLLPLKHAMIAQASDL